MTELWSNPNLWLHVAILLWLAVAFIGVILRRYSGPLMPLLTIAGCTALLCVVAGASDEFLALPSPWFLGSAGFRFLVDPLSRWFLAIIGLVGIPVALYAPGYLKHLRQQVSLGYVWAAMALLLASMAGVVLAANAVVFLVAWEVMALTSFVLVAADHEKKDIRRAAFIYLGATRIGTAFLMAGFVLAYHSSGSWEFSDWGLSGLAALAPALLILVGLATKAGCWPFHLWLPIAHPAAPAPVSALMSAVMIKTAVYALLRLFCIGQHIDSAVLGPVLLVLGAVSAFWGIVFALLQQDMKRLLAYSTVENVGIIFMGLGVALLARSYGLPGLAQLSLAAALLHSLNHALFKSLLFLGSGAVDAQTHLRNIDQLGGLIRRMPWTASAFVLGSAALCALPPLNGFTGEWLLYQSFFTLAQSGESISVRLASMLLMAWLALVGALAVACFIRVVGIAFLGTARSPQAEHAREVSPAMWLSQALLAVLCAALGIGVSLVLPQLGPIVSADSGALATALAWPLPTALLTLVLLLTVAAVSAFSWLQSRGHPTRRFITWECGFGPLGPRTQYTATSFTQPVSRIFGALYGYATSITVSGQERRHFPQAVEAGARHEAYLETRVYGPFLRSIQRLAGAFLMRLQAGSVHQYLFHMALVLALLLWLAVRQ